MSFLFFPAEFDEVDEALGNITRVSHQRMTGESVEQYLRARNDTPLDLQKRSMPQLNREMLIAG